MKAIEKKGYKTGGILKYLSALIIVLFLFSCTGGYSDSPYGNPVDLPDVSGEDPYSDPNDTDIVTLGLSVSVDYSYDDNMLTCYINVYDQDGEFVDTMNPDNFEVIANNIIITSAYRTLDMIESDETMIGLILDSSGSMYGQRMDDTKAAAKLFVDKMSSTDQAALIDFDTEARVAQQLTSDKTLLKTAIDGLEAEGGTNIGGGIIECVDAVGSRPGKTVSILLTDGEDNGGVIDTGIAKAVQMRMPVYTIFLGEDITDTARTDLERIADDTGGEFYEVMTAAELNSVFVSTIPKAIAAMPPRKSYVMTFENIYPTYSYINILFTLRYFNAWGLHTTDYSVSYYVDPSQ